VKVVMFVGPQDDKKHEWSYSIVKQWEYF